MRTLVLVPLLALACRAPEPSTPEAPHALALEGATIVTVDPPGRLEGYVLVVEGERIAALAPSNEVRVPEGARRIDLSGKFLVPGFADMHEHLPRGATEHEFGREAYFDLLLAAGVTTIRSMRGAPGDPELRDAIEAGEVEGPRLLVASPGVTEELAPDPSTARELVRRFEREGYDYLKVLEGFDLPTFRAMADEARLLELPLAGHLPREVPMELALETFHSIEHLHGHGSAFGADPDGFGELARRTRESGVWICPTLGFQRSWYLADSLEEMLAWPGMEFASDGIRDEWVAKTVERMEADEAALAEYARRMQSRRGAVRALADAGVPLLTSSSGGWFLIPGFSLFVEFEALAESGLEPEEILLAATLEAARSAGQEENWGSLRPGRFADVVVLDADPLEDIANAEAIHAVVRRGRWYGRAELDRRLERLR